MSEETKLFTIAEVAVLLKISKPTVYRLFEQGQLKWHWVGTHRRVSQDQLDGFLASTERKESKTDGSTAR